MKYYCLRKKELDYVYTSEHGRLLRCVVGRLFFALLGFAKKFIFVTYSCWIQVCLFGMSFFMSFVFLVLVLRTGMLF